MHPSLRELASHLHTREHRLDAGPGLLGRESASTLEGSGTAVAAYHASTIGL